MSRYKKRCQMTKICARCGKSFEEDDIFITCPECRRPLLDQLTGCHHWANILPQQKQIVDMRDFATKPRRWRKTDENDS